VNPNSVVLSMDLKYLVKGFQCLYRIVSASTGKYQGQLAPVFFHLPSRASR
jgi:hypothetical protein